jgi:tRNA threonylcarbamoyl adenosine modification protein (Sua5/YciO/YrdC/YwlC family)
LKAEREQFSSYANRQDAERRSAVTQVLRWQENESGMILRQAVEALRQGRLVALPAETVYLVAASAACPEAVAQLAACDDRRHPVSLIVALADASPLKEWVPDVSALGQRLARRCWPGLVTLAFPTSGEEGRISELPHDVRRQLCSQGFLGLYVPGTDALFAVVRDVGEPLLLSCVCLQGEAPAVTADEVVRRLGEEVALVVDTGPSEFGQEGTVVSVEGDTWRVLRPGIVPEAVIAESLPLHILFVCTGNTCRSPLAEGLCKKLLAGQVGCTPEELPELGYVVHSAGLAAGHGERAAEEAVLTAHEYGADLSRHQSKPVTPEMLARTDLLVAMTQHHLHLLSQLGPLAPPMRLLSADGSDVDDPIGGDREVYRSCARKIWSQLEILLPELQNGR